MNLSFIESIGVAAASAPLWGTPIFWLLTAHDAEEPTLQVIRGDIREARRMAIDAYEVASRHDELKARHFPIVAVAIVLVLFIVILTAEIESVFDDQEHGGNPPPEVSPIRESTLRMPLTYPISRHRDDWPPFEGVRIELGGDSN